MAQHRSRPRPLALFRRGVPVVLVVAGIVLFVTGPAGLGVVLVGVALFFLAMNVIIRLAISSQDDRDREGQRRSAFRRTGRWPDDDPPE